MSVYDPEPKKQMDDVGPGFIIMGGILLFSDLVLQLVIPQKQWTSWFMPTIFWVCFFLGVAFVSYGSRKLKQRRRIEASRVVTEREREAEQEQKVKKYG